MDHDKGVVGMLDTTSWTMSSWFPINDGDVMSMAWNATGDALVVGSSLDVAAWDRNSGARLWHRTCGTNPEWWLWAPVATHPDGDHAAAGMPEEPGGYTVNVLDASGDVVATLSDDVFADVNQIAISPDGQFVAVARFGGRLPRAPQDFAIDIWDWRAQEIVQTLDTEAFGMTWSPDGDRLVTADLRGAPQVWDLATGEMVLRLVGHDDANDHVVWSPDGSRIIAGGEDGTVRIWDAASGEQLQQFDFGMEGWIALALGPNGRWLAAGHNFRGMRVYALDLDDLVAIARTRVTRDLTPAECRTHLGGACPPTLLGG